MKYAEEFLIHYPELAVFLAIALGYLIGGVKFGGFALGPVTGSLLAGLAIGQIADVPVSGMAKSFLFLLFLFGIGYSVGPQFLPSIRQGGLKPIALSLVCAFTGLATAYFVARVLGLDQGYAAGMLSGALTQSPAMGTATEAIGALPLAEADRARLIAHVAVADAICYVFGAVGAIWFCSALAPRMLGVDLVAEAAALERELGVERAVPGLSSGYVPFVLRAYRIPVDARIVGETIGAAENRFAGSRLYILRLRRDADIIEAHPDLVIRAGDVLAIGGRRKEVIDILGKRAEEVEDEQLLDTPYLNLDVLVTSSGLAGHTLAELADAPWSHGINLHDVSRGRQHLPLASGVTLDKGDVLRVHGPRSAVEAAVERIGPVIAPTTSTDFITLGLAIFIGGLVGSLLQFRIAGITVMLGTSVGALLAGLAVGHMRTRFPLFGRIPDGAVALMTSLGLAAFVAMTGLHAGPIFFEALRTAGFGLLFGGLMVTFTPLVVTLFFGSKVLRMNPILLLGGLAGAMSMTAAMAAIQDAAKSPVPVLGYTPTYPIAQVLLTVWGSVIVMLTG